MTRPRLQLLLLAAGLGLVAALAETPTNAPSGPPGRTATPAVRSPMTAFRELLAMELPERKMALTNRPPDVQRRILAKVREYESLNAHQRELRLRATELRWHLMALMSLPPANRASRLAMVPDYLRKLVEDRLRQWDRLSPEARQEFLNNDEAARYLSRIQPGDPPPGTHDQLSPERRAKLQAGIEHWRSLSEEDRRKTWRQFNAFFELTPADKLRAMKVFSDAERRRMEKVMDTYAELPPEQRAQYLRSFEQYTSMSLAQRLQFLKNADRWKRMTPAEREHWRSLVKAAPLPPPQRKATPRPESPSSRLARPSLAQN